MRYVFAALLLLVGNAALACDTYTSTRKPAGERVLVDNWLELTIRENGKTQSFWAGNAGASSGIQVAHPRDGSIPMRIVRRQGEFWLADERFVEYCQTIAPPSPAPKLDGAIPAWLDARHTCQSGEDHYGVKVGEDDIKVACAEATALQELLEQAGYCEDPPNGWRRCAADQRSADAGPDPWGAIIVVPPVVLPVDRRIERWTVASRICLDGRDRGGARVSEEKADAACAETIVIFEDLRNDGYCRTADGRDWVSCN
jgi:hypothetical protein